MKKSVLPTTVSSWGEELLAPSRESGSMFLTSVVPARVPSLFQNSTPWMPSSAAKKRSLCKNPWRSEAISTGLELLGPALISATKMAPSVGTALSDGRQRSSRASSRGRKLVLRSVRDFTCVFMMVSFVV